MNFILPSKKYSHAFSQLKDIIKEKYKNEKYIFQQINNLKSINDFFTYRYRINDPYLIYFIDIPNSNDYCGFLFTHTKNVNGESSEVTPFLLKIQIEKGFRTPYLTYLKNDNFSTRLNYFVRKLSIENLDLVTFFQDTFSKQFDDLENIKIINSKVFSHKNEIAAAIQSQEDLISAALSQIDEMISTVHYQIESFFDSLEEQKEIALIDEKIRKLQDKRSKIKRIVDTKKKQKTDELKLIDLRNQRHKLDSQLKDIKRKKKELNKNLNS